MSLTSIKIRFGETPVEQFFGIIGFIAVTLAMVTSLLDLSRALYLAAWVVAVVAILAWNGLTFLRRRGERTPPGSTAP